VVLTKILVLWFKFQSFVMTHFSCINGAHSEKMSLYGCSINQEALFSTHGALYGNIPEYRGAEPQLQPPKRSRFMAFSLSRLFLLQPLSRAASSLSLLNRGLVKQKKYMIAMHGSAFVYPPPLPFRGVGLGSVVGAGLIREGVGPCVGWCEGDSVGYVGRCHSLELLRRV